MFIFFFFHDTRLRKCVPVKYMQEQWKNKFANLTVGLKTNCSLYNDGYKSAN